MSEVLGKLEEVSTRGKVILGNVMLAGVGVGLGSVVEEHAIHELIKNPGDKDSYVAAVFGAALIAGGTFFGRRAQRTFNSPEFADHEAWEARRRAYLDEL